MTDFYSSRANRLQHVSVVTRALPGWSAGMHKMTDYSRRAWFEDVYGGRVYTRKLFYLLSATGANGTAHIGDSGTGVMLRRHGNGRVELGGKDESTSGIGDVLYGVVIAGGLARYSLNETGGEAELSRYFIAAIAVQLIRGGETLRNSHPPLTSALKTSATTSTSATPMLVACPRCGLGSDSVECTCPGKGKLSPPSIHFNAL